MWGWGECGLPSKNPGVTANAGSASLAGSNFRPMETAVLVAIISAAAGIFASALTFFLTKRKEREAEWRKQKLESYKELISALSDIAAAEPPPEARVRFAHLANHILLVATPAVLVALRDFLDETADSNANKVINRHDEFLTILMYAIREDLGIKPNKASPQFQFRLWAAGSSKMPKPLSEGNMPEKH